MGVQEIAKRLGVSRQRADQLSRQKGFPDPVMVLANGRMRIWAHEAVETWAVENGYA